MSETEIFFLKTPAARLNLLGHQVVFALEQAGLKIIEVDAFTFLNNHSIDEDFSRSIFILDCALASEKCLGFIRLLRERYPIPPLLLLGDTPDLEFKLSCFRQGCDDVLLGDFSDQELIARLQAMIRRQDYYNENTGSFPSIEQESIGKGQLLFLGDIVLDPIKARVTNAQGEAKLTKKEFSLLEYFMRHPNQVIERSQILKEVWGYDFDPKTNLVDVHVKSLRKKLNLGVENSPLKTIRGRGYLIEGAPRV